ncbi:MAG: phosphatidylserine decarboxylase [Planctomycetales bacterium]|nr:phosphatidylserine decarboxylase [Planctomycetales bacterium]
MAVFPALIIAAMAVYYYIARRYMQPGCACPVGTLLVWLPEAALLVVLIWVFSFFRDPYRTIVQDANLLLSPADGMVMAVETLDACEGFDGPVLRVEIFLSIFNVHINRIPCPVEIGKITYKPGRFLDARRPECSKVNEANEVEMFRLDEPKDRLLVRQVSGAIARRIVCTAKQGQHCTGGQQFGMIKFGSCTELYVPARSNLLCTVNKGDNVKAGLTVLARYQ